MLHRLLRAIPRERFCVAPMMRRTDRHCRYLLRLISRRAMLYTEMYAAAGVLRNGGELLEFHALERPLGVQLGGGVSEEMVRAAMIAEDHGYDEVNVNAGCPSAKAGAGNFGACLMTQPSRLAECVAEMTARLSVPVTVKCRVGVDHLDSYEAFREFIRVVAQAGCRTFIIHARKAWLKGLSPKANRQLPKLRYDYVYRLKRDFPELRLILNGGLESPEAALIHVERGLDGVMLGRAIYNQPLLLRSVDRLYYGDARAALRKREILQAYLGYMERQLRLGVPFYLLARHLINFYRQQNGAGFWRRQLTHQLRKARHPLLELERLIIQFERHGNAMASV